MNKVKLWDKTFVPFIKNQDLEEAIDRVAVKLNEDFANCEDVPVLLCTLNGAILFCAELMKRLTFTCELASVKLKSYSGTTSTGMVTIQVPVTVPVAGRRVIIVEDIVDTGATIATLRNYIQGQGASEIRTCTMLFKPDVFDGEKLPEYIAMEIPSRFIVGFGLDYNEIGRNLQEIYVLDENS